MAITAFQGPVLSPAEQNIKVGYVLAFNVTQYVFKQKEHKTF